MFIKGFIAAAGPTVDVGTGVDIVGNGDSDGVGNGVSNGVGVDGGGKAVPHGISVPCHAPFEQMFNLLFSLHSFDLPRHAINSRIPPHGTLLPYHRPPEQIFSV